MNRFILHIGTPKTGTTALQEFLYDNPKWLNDNGFCYPDIRRRFRFSRIYRDLNVTRNADILRMFTRYTGFREKVGNDIWKKMWKILNSELKNHNVIFSSEDIWGMGEDIVKACKECCMSDEFYVVVYLRRQDKYIESNWNQSVKSTFFLEETFQEYYENRKDRKDFCNYLERLKNFEKVVGKEKLIVRAYEKEQFEGKRKDIISDFCSVTGMEIDEQRVKVRDYSNTGLDYNHLEIKRLMNPILKYWRENRDEHCANIVSFKFEEFSTNKNRTKTGVYFSPEQRRSFLEKMEPQNREIASYYLGRTDGRLFYDQRMPGDPEEIDESNMQKDIIESFTFLLLSQQEEMENISERQRNFFRWALHRLNKEQAREGNS